MASLPGVPPGESRDGSQDIHSFGAEADGFVLLAPDVRYHSGLRRNTAGATGIGVGAEYFFRPLLAARAGSAYRPLALADTEPILTAMRFASCPVLFLAAALAAGAVETSDIAARLAQLPPSHPRLFLKAGEEAALRKLGSDPVRARLHAGLVAAADKMLTEAPVERTLTGRRLLHQSRTCLSRVLHLGFAWRLTGERKYAERARVELLAAAAFSDWNPSHFLDVAEMTAALGIGYDWFYSFLDEDARAAVRDAIVTKGLRPGTAALSWTRATHNWNQVCNAGLTVGALAVAESEPELAAQLIARAINTVPLAMHEYGPDGAYPEGVSYWGYGTTFNVILLSALQSVLGSDFGLSGQPGFLATADYMLHMFGPTGLPFNYSDAGSREGGLHPAMFWLAAARGEPGLLWTEWRKLDGTGRLSGDRADPFLALWMTPGLARPAAAPPLDWTGGGLTPVASHRTGWDADAVFVAIKGGSPATNHAHMDVGSFVVDADGVRWADDLGMQDYNSLETKGVDLWGRGQNAGRWKVFRLGASAHNVLTVDGAGQRYESRAPLTVSKRGVTVVELSDTYRGQLAKAARGVELRPDRTVLIQDEFSAMEGKAATVRWAMLTRAEVKIDGAGRATLSREGRTLQLRVLEPVGVPLRIYATDPPPAATDAPNPGTRMVGFEVSTAAGASRRMRVQLVPQSATASPVPLRPLSGW